MRTRYKFSHRGADNRYYWYATTRIPGDSRTEQVSCDVDWFWNPLTPPSSPRSQPHHPQLRRARLLPGVPQQRQPRSGE